MCPTSDIPRLDLSRQPDWLRFFPDADHRWRMGLRRGEAAAFFAPGETATEVLAERAHWLATDPESYVALMPAAEPGLRETVQLAREWGAKIEPAQSPWDQLLCLGRTWEADLVWLVADEEGVSRVAGGVVCFPSSWALREKLGQTLGETHRPVPGMDAALDRPMEVFLDRLVPGEAWLRENAGYSGSAERNQHPDQPHRALTATVSVDEVWIRLEHQLLLKLPVSQALLFGIRVEVVPLRWVRDVPWAAARLTRLLRTLSPQAAEYKGLSEARAGLVAQLLEAQSRVADESTSTEANQSSGEIP